MGAICLEWGCNTAAERSGAEPASTSDSTDWALLPFVKVDSVNPVLQPGVGTFMDPIWKKKVAWEEKDVFNPAIVVAKHAYPLQNWKIELRRLCLRDCDY